MKSLRGKRVLITIPELKKSKIEISAQDEDAILALFDQAKQLRDKNMNNKDLV